MLNFQTHTIRILVRISRQTLYPILLLTSFFLVSASSVQFNVTHLFAQNSPAIIEQLSTTNRSSSATEIPDYGDSFRIATFNVQFLPKEFAPDGCCENIKDRPRKIAERILAGDYDVIVLNEAFIDEIQEGLTSILRESYPYYVQKVHDNDLFHQDSGLMLLSRFPFEPLKNSSYKAKHLIASSNEVAYREYANESFLCYTCPPIRDHNGNIIVIY